MSLPFVPFDAEAMLDWIALTDALAAGHKWPKAQVGDTFLTRDNDTLLSRSAWTDGLGSLVKTATIFPGNDALDKPTINGSVTLYDDRTGEAEALLDFHLVTKWKTAGDSLLAARRLARADSESVLIIGAGTVAASLIEAYGAAFPKARFSIWNRSRDKAVALAERTGAGVADELETAVRSADIVSSATMARVPMVLGEWLQPGQHIDLIGAYKADMRETDDLAMQRARVFVDSFDTTLDHIGELMMPLASGAITRDHVLADYYRLGAFERQPDDITLFKNGGGAHLDLMTARYILDVWKAPAG